MDDYGNLALAAARFYRSLRVIEEFRAGEEPWLPCTAATRRFFSAIPQVRNVLDFGGGFGVGYFSLHQPCRWAVVETITTAVMASLLGGESLKFFDSLEGAHAWLGEVDIVHTNSAIQYTEYPEGSLRALCAFRARYMLLMRCDLEEERQLRTQVAGIEHQGPGNIPLPQCIKWRNFCYPCTTMARKDFEAIMSGYERIDEECSSFLYRRK